VIHGQPVFVNLGGPAGGQLNNGGLAKFYWLLAAILAVDFLLFLLCAYRYEYKHDWYGSASPPPVNGDEKPYQKVVDDVE
jgi:hypothetical protein